MELRLSCTKPIDIMAWNASICEGTPISHQWIPLTKGHWCWLLMFLLLLAWTSCYTNCWVASNLRHRDTHGDIIVMLWPWIKGLFQQIGMMRSEQNVKSAQHHFEMVNKISVVCSEFHRKLFTVVQLKNKTSLVRWWLGTKNKRQTTTWNNDDW